MSVPVGSDARTVRVTHYAAAADATGVETEEVATDAATLGALSRLLAERHGRPLRDLLEVSAFVVGGRVVRDPATPLAGVTEVDVLPPFAGG